MRFFVALLTMLLVGAPFAGAHSIAGEPAGFTPSFLISDTNFTNSGTMNAEAINNFLAAQGSWLANYIIPEYVDVPYFCYNTSTGNNEIPYALGVRQMHVNGTTRLYGMRAADLIAERAQAIGLNPQVILTLLQRESTAITRSAPSSDTTRAWPLFYGFNDTMKNFQYTCASGTAQQLASDYGGLGQQIAYATFSLRNRYNTADDWQTSSCSWSGGAVTDNGTCFNVSNRASRALYVYTPAVHTGNHNFWYYFTVWFANIVNQPTPNFRLIKGSGPALYLHDKTNNQRYYFDSIVDLNGWGFTTNDANPVSDDTLNAIPSAGIVTRLIKGSGSATYYMESGFKHHIRTDGLFGDYSLAWSQLATISDVLLNQVRFGPAIGGLMKGGSDPDVYLASNGRKWYVPNAFVMNSWGYDWRDIDVVPDTILYAYPRSNLEILVKGSRTPQVYVMIGGRRYYVSDAATFTHYGLSWANLATIGEETKNAFPEGPALGRLVRGTGPHVYIIENSKKRHVQSSAGLAKAGFSWNQLIQISDDLLAIYPAGTPVN